MKHFLKKAFGLFLILLPIIALMITLSFFYGSKVYLVFLGWAFFAGISIFVANLGMHIFLDD